MPTKNINLERVFDLITHLKDNPGEDYIFDVKKNIKLKPEQQSVVIYRSIQAFIQGSASMNNGKLIQAFSGSSDLPVLTKDVFNVTQAVPEFDTLWQQAFKGVPLKKGQLSWEVADVVDGLTFSLIPEGGKAKFFGVSGSKIIVGIDKYGAGLGITWEMVEGRKLYAFVDQMNAVRTKLNELWADIHYGLLATAGAANQLAYDTTGTTVTQKDINTINAAYTKIGDAVKDKGYGDVANVPMVLYFTPTHKSRMMQALRATNADLVTSGIAASQGQVEFNVVPATTWNSAIAADTALLVLAGNKIQNSVYMQELGLRERDIESLSDLQTYWSAFGAVVADTDQVVELALA